MTSSMPLTGVETASRSARRNTMGGASMPAVPGGAGFESSGMRE
jgi:hypothetical protein